MTTDLKIVTQMNSLILILGIWLEASGPFHNVWNKGMCHGPVQEVFVN